MRTSVLLRLALSQILIYSAMVGARLAAPLYVLSTGLGPVLSGLAIAVFALVPALISVHVSRVIERRGLSVPMRICLVISLAGFLAPVVMPGMLALCITGLLAGGSTNAATVALMRYSGRASTDSDSLKKSFAWMSMGPAAANLIGPMAAGLMIDHAGLVPRDARGFQAAFLTMALLTFLGWALVIGLPEIAPAPGAADPRRNRVGELLRTPGMIALLFINWTLAISWDTHGVIVPILGTERGLSASMIATVMSCMAISATVVRVLMPLVVTRAREHVVLAVSLGLAALAFALYPFTQSAWSMMACALLLGATVGSVQPLVVIALYQISPEGRQSEALGLRIMTLNASNLVSPTLSAALTTLIGVAPVFWVAALAVGLGVVPSWRLPVTIARARQASQAGAPESTQATAR